MKPLLLPLAIFALCIAFSHAQEEAPGLIPEIPEAPAKSKPAATTESKKSSTEEAADEMQARIRMRDVKTRALQDPKVQAEWARAHVTKTDRERREVLKSYYTMLYDGMIKIDHSLKPRVEALRKALDWRLEQRGIKPSKAVDNDEELPVFGRQ